MPKQPEAQQPKKLEDLDKHERIGLRMEDKKNVNVDIDEDGQIQVDPQDTVW